MREAALAREMHTAGARGVKSLYLGFYVHSCAKMRYKGEYAPSFLLDPVRPALPHPHVLTRAPNRRRTRGIRWKSGARCSSGGTTRPSRARSATARSATRRRSTRRSSRRCSRACASLTPCAGTASSSAPCPCVTLPLPPREALLTARVQESKLWRNSSSQQGMRQTVAALGAELAASVIFQ